MQNLVENYRLALAKRKAARRAEAKAHKHARRELMYRSAEFWRDFDQQREQAEREAAAARKERAAAIAERNEMAGLVFLVDVPNPYYPAE